MADSDAEGDVVGLQPSEEVGADKLPIGYQAVNLVAANQGEELSQQINAFLGIGVAPFRQGTKEKRKGDALVDPFDYRSGGQDEEVDGHGSKHPLGSVESQGVGGVG